tara:strand:- start:1301 stop:1552 length:252 start_codon:yes stop_codon:yes gene_type:complete
MAPRTGKTARHYRRNKRSRLKHIRDNSPGGKYAHSKAYKRAHSKARASLKIKSPNVDASKQSDGSYRAESRRTNRARGGAQRR